MRRDVILAVLAGCLGGLLHIAVTGGGLGSVILGFLAMVPLFAVGLGLGLIPALVAGATGIAIVVATAGMLSGLFFALAYLAPVAVLTRQALLNRPGATGNQEWYPPGLLLVWLTGLGGVVALFVILQPADLARDAAMRDELARAFSQFTAIDPAAATRTADLMLSILPGQFAVSWMLMVIVNSALAQGLLARFGRNLRPSPAIADIRLPLAIPAAFGLALAIGLIGGALSRYGFIAVMILAVPLCMQGLAVVHAFAARFAAPGLLLFVFYFMLLFGWLLPLVLLLGVIEQWAGLCRRFKRGPPDQEDE